MGDNMNSSLNTIYVKKEYGKVNMRLKEIMDAKGIKRHTLARTVDTRFEVIDKWYNNKVENLDLDILARLCFVLECSIEDGVFDQLEQQLTQLEAQA